MSLRSDFISKVFIKVLDLPIILVNLLMHTPVDSMEGRQPGLQGSKYKGRRVLPESLMHDLDTANVL
jgi:hypothetical protein